MLTAGEHVDVSAVKRFTLAAGELISMCAHKLGIKIFAAKGKVEIQAQSDGLALFASKQVHIASVDEDVLIAACSKAGRTRRLRYCLASSSQERFQAHRLLQSDIVKP